MRILFQYSGSQKHLLIAQSSLLLLLQIFLFIILKFIKSQSQLYQSELLLQLISFTIPNLSCLLPIGPYLIHSNFLNLILIPIRLIPTSFTVDFHSNSQPILPVPNCSLSHLYIVPKPCPIPTLWTLVDSRLEFL